VSPESQSYRLDTQYRPRTLQEAILCTVAYADVFRYPLTASQIQRYLIGLNASRQMVSAALIEGRGLSGVLVNQSQYYCLRGRESNMERRTTREVAATWMWPRAVRYGWAIGRMPFVRMVAVTGALAVNNADPGADLDYMIVTEPDRLWLCRLLIVALVRAVARGGDVICPNYVLSERALDLPEHNLFTAHEVLQMVPVVGLETYAHLRWLNAWTEQFLPNAHRQTVCLGIPPAYPQRLRPLAEAALRTPLGGWLERWEMRRKVPKFRQRGAGGGEAQFSTDWCKGHFGGYGQRTLDGFGDRLRWLYEQGALSDETFARAVAVPMHGDDVPASART
jgi:hypothetical protein